MKVRFSDLQRLMAEKMSAAEFLARAGAQPGAARAQTDGIVSIETIEDADLTIARPEVKALCRLFYGKSVSANELAAIADALLASERVAFVDTECGDWIEQMSGADAPFTVIRALEILER